MLPASNLGDRYGRKRMLTGSLVLFLPEARSARLLALDVPGAGERRDGSA